MARTEITVTNITTTAAAPASEVTGNNVDGHYVANDGRTFLVLRNADSGGAHVVTIKLLNVDGQAVTGKPVSVPASSTRQIRLGDPRIYGTRTNVDVDVATHLKLTAYRIA